MKLRVFIVSVFFICSLLSGISLAQNKVVVIPLDSGDCDCDEIPTVTSAGQVWMDRNLGALQVAQNVNDYRARGWLYQWGRLADGHEVIYRPTTHIPSNSNVPGHDLFITTSSSPYDWRVPQNDNLWQGVSGVNNPCPTGFRVPTYAEWETERDSWNSNDAAGAFASPLKLVYAGERLHDNGNLLLIFDNGFYWSSSAFGSLAMYLGFDSSSADVYPGRRAFGFSVRCIKD